MPKFRVFVRVTAVYEQEVHVSAATKTDAEKEVREGRGSIFNEECVDVIGDREISSENTEEIQ